MDPFELALKEMTKEDFQEEEHPRDPSGQFTDKPGSKTKSKKVSTDHRKTAYKAAAAVAGTAAITLAVLALRRSSVFKSELDDIAKNVDNIIKESKPIKEGLSKTDIESKLKDVPYSVETPREAPIEKAKESIPELPKESTPIPVKESPKIDLEDLSSFESKKLIREVDETLDDATKNAFGVTFQSKNLKDLDRVFSGRIKQGYWTDENFIDPLFSLNKLRKSKDITSADFNNVINFYAASRLELRKELRFINRLSPESRNKVIAIKKKIELANFSELSARYKRSVYLGKINEKSDAIIKYRAASEDIFDKYTMASRELDRIEKAISAKPSTKDLAKLVRERARAEQVKDRTEKIYKILNSDADTVLVNADDVAGFKKEFGESGLDELAERFAKDYGVRFPREMKAEDIGLSYEKKRVTGGKKTGDRELKKRMLKERIQRKYKKKTDKEIEDLVEELSKKEKSFSGDTSITKAMTSEQFDELEHPRDSSGKFTDKPGVAPKTETPKGSHGGYRKFSGRLPKNTAEAVEIQRQKYQQKNPEASEQEINNRLVEYGEKRNKGADWYLYVTNKEKYDKIEKQRMEDAKKTKINRAYVNGQEVEWRPPINVKDSVREQSNRFRRDLAKYKSVKEASKKFMDKEAPAQERNAARLILSVGTIATALTLASIIARRPKLEPIKAVTPHAFKDVPGAGKVPQWYAEDIAKNIVPQEARLFQLNKVMGEGGVKNPFREVQTANSFNKILGMFIAKNIAKAGKPGIRGEAANLLRSGKPVSISFGPGKSGYTGRFRLHDEYIEVFQKGTKAEYIPRAGDRGYFGKGKWINITEQDGKVSVEKLKDIWVAKKIKGPLPSGLALNKNNQVIIEDLGKFKKHAEESGWIKRTGEKYVTLRQDGDLFPSTIQRKWSTLGEARGARKEINDYGGYADVINRTLPGISNKILALLSLTPGAGATLYYFSMDIKDAAANLKKAREEQLRISKKLSEPIVESGNKQKKKAQQTKPKKTAPQPKEDVTPDLEEVQNIPSKEEYEEIGLHPDLTEEQIKRQKKGYEPNIDNETELDIDVTDAIALQVAEDISNISQACQYAIESGMPGSDQFIQINNKLIEMYTVLKDKSKEIQ